MNEPLEDFDPVGFTCPMTFDGERFVVTSHICPFCRKWSEKTEKTERKE